MRMRPAARTSLPLVAAALVLVSCASPQSPMPSPAPETTETSVTGHGAYAECLAEHGVPTPPVGPGAPPGVDAQTWARAQEACADQGPGPAG